MKRFVFIMINLFILLSCCKPIKEETNTAKSFIKNSTQHFLKLNFYKDGDIVGNETIIIEPQENKNVLTNTGKGKGSGLDYARHQNFQDSVIIIFDNLKKSVFYSSSIDTNNLNGIGFNNSRNIFNKNNYSSKRYDETKYSVFNEYLFEFTEQDYLKAK